MIQQRLAQLREQMAERNIAIYIVPTADFHDSEYVGAHFKARKFITGFTGSAGTAVITMTEAGLWTDARYFLQADKQLEGTAITLYRMGEDEVPTVQEYVEKTLQEGECIGFDGRVVNASLGREFEEIAQKKNGSVYADEDLVDIIWADRPKLPKEPVWLLGEEFSGKSTAEKLADVRKEMDEKKATLHLMTSLYDIAWLLNVRGNDIEYVPVVLSYLAILEDACIWFVQEEALNSEVRGYLEENHIEVRPYESFYGYVKGIDADKKVLLNPSVVNYRICSSIPEGVEVIDGPDPTERMKAVKNETELANTRKAHVKDAVAMCRFMYWLKKNIGKIPMTEISAADYLEELRSQQEGYMELSFETICGYGEHGAIVHYSATPETDAELKPEGFLLVDSGGHYMEGTSDVTRTFALGPVSDEMKTDFTRVCRSNMNLANVRFLYGCSGANLDIVARQPFWEAGMDYKHGTGHGVGYVLNVHEGPNGFRWKIPSKDADRGILEEGMVTTDEPGFYLEGSYGIRIEDELVCRKGEKNTYGQFMYFENLTYVPVDLDALDPDQLSETERGWLNSYHENVYRTVAPYLEEDEREFLKEYTREI